MSEKVHERVHDIQDYVKVFGNSNIYHFVELRNSIVNTRFTTMCSAKTKMQNIKDENNIDIDSDELYTMEPCKDCIRMLQNKYFNNSNICDICERPDYIFDIETDMKIIHNALFDNNSIYICGDCLDDISE